MLNWLRRVSLDWRDAVALIRILLTCLPLEYLIFLILIIWLSEWLLLIEYIFNEWQRTTILFPSRLPFLLILLTFYWFYLWGIAVWRRTQFGKFTRGERKLWAKAITSFWVAELVTAGSFILVYCWMSWGPLPLVPRRFLVSRKGIIIELVVYSYMLILAYAAKFAVKWNLWKSQLTLSLTIIVIFTYLLWKDVILLVLRDNMYLHSNARWRNLRTTAVVYTLSHEWWNWHLTKNRSLVSLYKDLLTVLSTKQRPFAEAIPLISEYEYNLWLNEICYKQRVKKIFPVLNFIKNYETHYSHMLFSYIEAQFYPRRTGFIPKRLSMWQFLMILKMWHHLVIILWWALYVYKLLYRKKTAYPILGVCYFNIYCCYILALLVYSIYMMTFWENAMKFRPNIFNLHRWTLHNFSAMWYNFTLFCISKNWNAIIHYWL